PPPLEARSTVTCAAEGTPTGADPTAAAVRPVSEKIDPTKLKPADFMFGKCLGEGAYARVVHAKFKKNNHEFAIKIMEKRHIKKENKIKYVMMEKNILSKLNSPLIVRLFYTFQDHDYLYMCMEIAHGGELLRLIEQFKEKNEAAGVPSVACSVEMTRFYTAEIIEAIQYLHDRCIVHRDIKPENILVSGEGHIKVTDFGTALLSNGADETSRNSFVGTAEYVSPEVLQNEDATAACDMWAVGCVVYQLLTGASPFHTASEYLTFNCILAHCDGSEPLKFTDTIDETAQNLISQLIAPDPNERLGSGAEGSGRDMAALCSHPFFTGVDNPIRWGHLLEQEVPYHPDPATFPSTTSMRDGADDEWLSDGEATPIAYNPVAYKKGARPSVDGQDSFSRAAVHSTPGGTGFANVVPLLVGDMDNVSSPPAKADLGRYWDSHLLLGEEHVFGGIVWKRKGLFSKRRQLVLTNKPRLIYFDPATTEQKGEIPWSIEYPVECIPMSGSSFDILAKATGRRYHITDSEAGSQMWMDLIAAMLQKQREIA
ncbi:unnamed protein product, partial [Ectocarpus fasciculatus]